MTPNLATRQAMRLEAVPPSLSPTSTGKHNGVEIGRRRLFGAYYTPDALAGILVEWALADGAGAVLDPSFGGCAFLNAAARTLGAKGVRDPGRLVYGVDIDPSCIAYVHSSEALEPDNCTFRDFLEVRPNEVKGAPFEAVVGNPPYVRHHWLKGAKRSAARALVDDSSITLPATASTWAYFIVHALNFLRPSGRLAMLVPEAILQADYAVPVRNALAARFSSLSLIHIRDRLFEGTDEPVVVIAGAGFGKADKVSIEAVESADDLVGALKGSTRRKRSQNVTVANGRKVSRSVLDLLKSLENTDSVRPVGALATARIGIVTGANNYFVRSRRELVQLGIPSNARIPVVSRTTWLSGLEFTLEDHSSLVDSDRRALLVRPTPAIVDHEGVMDWIAEGEAAGLNERFKCIQRLPWFRVVLPKAPDAFASCTRLGSPLLVLNRAGYRCTNALYSVAWRADMNVDPKVIAVGFLTSAVALWAELHGRRYGGGVLKLDLGTLGKVPVPLAPRALDAFGDIDKLLRCGREPEARALADRVVLVEGFNVEERDVRGLQSAQRDLVAQRVPTSRRVNGG